MTRPVVSSGLFRQFRIPALRPNCPSGPDADAALEVALDRPVELVVGGEGIIGRRVSVLREDGSLATATAAATVPLADGIVGFNSF